MPASANSNILYFPHIEVTDTALLKSALCIWESVYRIVPEGYAPRDSEDVQRVVDAGRLKSINLTSSDLRGAREAYTDFLRSLSFLPDALDRSGEEGRVRIHHEKMDQVIIQELSDLLGVITRDGDWLELPRGVADGYMLFLSNVVAEKRKLAKFTDSDSMFVAMQYFDVDGNIGELASPNDEDDAIAALIFKQFVPGGAESATMDQILKFGESNRDGRESFRNALRAFADDLAKVDDPRFVSDVVNQLKDDFEQAKILNMSRIREHFSSIQPLLIYFGLPLAGKVLESITGVHEPMGLVAGFGVAGIAALADLTKTGRREWATREGTYYCKLNREFPTNSPIPRSMKRLDRMMEEFVND